MKYFPFACAKAGKCRKIFCYCGDCDAERILFLGRGTQKVIPHRIEESQAHNTELSSFSQDTDLQEDPQITANIKLNPANNSSVVVLLK